MDEDLSNRTITILVVLTVTISVLGTLSVMNAVNEVKMQQTTIVQPPSQGKVGLNVLDSSQDNVKEKNSATGMVGLELKTPEEPEKKNDRILLLPY